MVNGHSFILIRQIAALVRRALAELCTVPVLLVFNNFDLLTDMLRVRANMRVV